ncbi:hypothetical protein PIB30_010505 [Stylosanthes scabra]|uniref:Uncharacterized protein n=1 Tax=Stylosanthes scabra TaxID=79078 RepID=A0ABU6Q6H8_9FABA|nr:hypothetical protein [Stylosanthes scabra]
MLLSRLALRFSTIQRSIKLRLHHSGLICKEKQLIVARVLEPLVEEALRPDDSDDELAFIEGDSDDDIGPVPTQQGSASSSCTQQYLPQLSNLNLEALFVPGGGKVNQTVAHKALKNYNIRHGVEHRVMSPIMQSTSDGARYSERVISSDHRQLDCHVICDFIFSLIRGDASVSIKEL